MAKVNVVWKGMYVGTEKMSTDQIRKAEYAGLRRINLCTDSEFDYNSHNYGCRFKGKCSYYIVKGRLFQSASIPKTQNELNKIYLCYTQIINDSNANYKSK